MGWDAKMEHVFAVLAILFTFLLFILYRTETLTLPFTIFSLILGNAVLVLTAALYFWRRSQRKDKK
jgi:hypothetical protein